MKRILIAATLAATAMMAQAQYVGPSTVPVATVKALQADGRDDQPAVLRGQIVSSVGHELYRFDDGTGQMRVKIKQRLWPAGQPVGAATKVELIGEYDKEWVGEPKFKVKQIRLL
ncbi:NirD/YgiW/YdeI family stress tolerance protein [Cupriavidus basilensis]|uniref:NirD/YgiW/YdeI family stress tolerance protein n=1 Tax=Cupriavidus basilensis TaxID=68895 RepID=A0ABT6AGT2_9BURK|nr:NirD/YgiW/YdeI family stress tolerance protein [Cupriavidus basilensis]MDF3831684.1 NirD/YgiW/YdeI family stress tolerance protein [Cupriavidus basilensis]